MLNTDSFVLKIRRDNMTIQPDILHNLGQSCQMSKWLGPTCRMSCSNEDHMPCRQYQHEPWAQGPMDMPLPPCSLHHAVCRHPGVPHPNSPAISLSYSLHLHCALQVSPSSWAVHHASPHSRVRAGNRRTWNNLLR